MKKIIRVVLATLVITMASFAQTANVFFSEYVEGTSSSGVYNRALEIYNGTGAELDMSAFIIKSGYSGNNNEWNNDVYVFPEGTVLAAGEVWVIANDGAAEEILSVANDTVQYNTFGYVVAFSGDDTRGLFQIVNGDTVLIDIIGVYQEVPENGGWDVAGVPAATKDHTLVRKSSVQTGNTDWSSSAGTDADNSEWIVYDKDTFDYLGQHSGPDAVEGEVEQHVVSFELMQNYPNPFNPTTTIKYSIPELNRSGMTGFTSLRIYNVLGEEIATLVNEYQTPGNYTVQFDANNLPSGVYYYTLKVGNFVATKKMILMK